MIIWTKNLCTQIQHEYISQTKPKYFEFSSPNPPHTYALTLKAIIPFVLVITIYIYM